MIRSINRKQVRRILIACLASSGIVLSITFLAAQHRPGWYKPVKLDPLNEGALRSVRREATNTFDAFGDLLFEGKPFEFTLTDESINQVLTALPQIWPEAAETIPQELSELAVHFGKGWVRAGALVSAPNWKAIGSVKVSLSLNEDHSTIKAALVGANCGSLPLPRVVLEPGIDKNLKVASGGSTNSKIMPSPDSDVVSFRSASQLYDGISIPNRFTWPNGNRKFRIKSVKLTDGKVQLEIEPTR